MRGGAKKKSKKPEEIVVNGKNFVGWEDEALIQCLVNTSLDPCDGCYQKGGDFYGTVHKSWCILHAAAPLSQKIYPEIRTQKQLFVRWTKTIRKEIPPFLRYYKQVKQEMPTGFPESQYIDQAGERFRMALGYEFKWKSSIPTLAKLAKYNIKHADFVGNNERPPAAHQPPPVLEAAAAAEVVVVEPPNDAGDAAPPAVAVAAAAGAAAAPVAANPRIPIGPAFDTTSLAKPTGVKKAKESQFASRVAHSLGVEGVEEPRQDRVEAAKVIASSVDDLKSELKILNNSLSKHLEIDGLIRLGFKQKAHMVLRSYTTALKSANESSSGSDSEDEEKKSEMEKLRETSREYRRMKEERHKAAMVVVRAKSKERIAQRVATGDWKLPSSPESDDNWATPSGLHSTYSKQPAPVKNVNNDDDDDWGKSPPKQVQYGPRKENKWERHERIHRRVREEIAAQMEAIKAGITPHVMTTPAPAAATTPAVPTVSHTKSPLSPLLLDYGELEDDAVQKKAATPCSPVIVNNIVTCTNVTMTNNVPPSNITRKRKSPPLHERFKHEEDASRLVEVKAVPEMSQLTMGPDDIIYYGGESQMEDLLSKTPV